MPQISTVIISEPNIPSPTPVRRRGRPPRNPVPTLENGEPQTAKQEPLTRNFKHKPIRTGDEPPCLNRCKGGCLPCSIQSFGRDQKGWPIAILKQTQKSDVTTVEKPSFLPKKKPNVSAPPTPVVGTTSQTEIVTVDLMIDDDEDELDLFS